MKTITLTENPMTFEQALKYLLEGKCIGIKPATYDNFLVKYRPLWMKSEPDYLLKWNGESAVANIKTSQFLCDWFPVIINHNEFEIGDKITLV